MIIIYLKGSLEESHFIFEINVGKGRIRHRTILKSNDEFLDRLKIDWKMIQIQSRSMSDPTFSDIDFKIKMASMWTTLKFYDIIYMINRVGQRGEKT